MSRRNLIAALAIALALGFLGGWLAARLAQVSQGAHDAPEELHRRAAEQLVK